MLTVETIGRIRREPFLKGKKIKEIVRDLRISRSTVRKVLRSGETASRMDAKAEVRAMAIGPRRTAGMPCGQAIARAIDADPFVRGPAGAWI